MSYDFGNRGYTRLTDRTADALEAVESALAILDQSYAKMASSKNVAFDRYIADTGSSAYLAIPRDKRPQRPEFLTDDIPEILEPRQHEFQNGKAYTAYKAFARAVAISELSEFAKANAKEMRVLPRYTSETEEEKNERVGRLRQSLHAALLAPISAARDPGFIQGQDLKGRFNRKIDDLEQHVRTTVRSSLNGLHAR